MNKIFYILAVFSILLTACSQENKNNAAQINFKGNTTYDFGKIKYKNKAEAVFEFENTGKLPLIITNVSSSCGCTVPEYPAEPVSEGKSEKIIVRYDTERVGQFTKTVKIYSNTNTSPVKLVIKGEVLPPEKNN